MNGTGGGSGTVTAPRGQFKINATLVIIGISGTGKSSLAFLAASAYNRRVIEFDREFNDRTGQTLAAHRQTERNRAGRKKREEVLNQTLNDHDQGAVIVCDFTDLEYGSKVILAFSHQHPVIYVNRDVEGIHDYLSWDMQKISHLSSNSAHLLRECSNFEYYNWTETEPEAQAAKTVSAYVNASSGGQAGDDSSTLSFLKLKRTERDFLNFLRRVLGQHERTPSQQSAYPLSHLPLQSRNFTYAASITVEEVLDGQRDVEVLQTGADAIQLQISRLPKSKEERQVQLTLVARAFAIVRRASILPIILDPCLTDRLDSSDYTDIWKACCRLAPEYVTFDLSIDEGTRFMTGKGNTSVIGVAHLGDWSSGQAEERHRHASVLGCDGVMLLSNSVSQDTLDHSLQSFRCRAMKQKAGQSPTPLLSTYNLGELGRFTQYTNTGLLLVKGAGPRTADSVHNVRSSDLTAQDATRALFSSYIYAPLNFSIVGGDVDYSLSPALHNAAYNALGMPHMYSTRSTPTLDVLDQFKQDHNYGGSSVTQPYKIAVLDRLDSVSKHARVIRAVNTVLPIRGPLDDKEQVTDLGIVKSRNQSGPIYGLRGDNTDWIGMRACLRRGLSPVNAVRKNSVGLVLGAGGMARAGIYAMLHMGVQQVFVCNRTQSRAEELADYFNKWIRSGEMNSDSVDGEASTAEVHVLPTLHSPWPKGFRHPTMIISSVPTELMTEENYLIPPALLASPTGGVVVELTYKPIVTALVRQITEQASRGWIIMTGLDMLPEQAFAQFELFTGRRAPRHVMRAEVLKEFQRQQNQA